MAVTVTAPGRDDEQMVAALALQAAGCRQLGSPLYGDLFDRLASGYLSPQAAAIRHVLGARFERPIHDAAPLRLAGSVHRRALRGEAPALARAFPSCGGIYDPSRADDVWRAFVDEVTMNAGSIASELGGQVQTNEVGRAAALVGGFCLIARRDAGRLRLLELGASAGLNLRWDRYFFDTGISSCGEPASTMRFTDRWAGIPQLQPVEVVEREGCDIAPLDATDPTAQLRLLSFVWPDQIARRSQLRTALDIAVASPPVSIVKQDAGAWLSAQLRRPSPAARAASPVTTVVYHSIVWQYLPADTQAQIKAALHDAGRQASPEAPLAWLRMEPAGPVADVRLTSWPGGHEEVLATTSYHGVDIDWIGPTH